MKKFFNERNIPMISKNISLNLFLFLLIIYFSAITGCGDTPTFVPPPTPINVTGNVTDVYGNPPEYDQNHNKIEIQNITHPLNSDGSFSFSNVHIPYDAKLTLDKKTYLYKGYSTDKLNLSTLDTVFNAVQSANLEVVIPVLTNERAKIIFTDKKNVQDDLDYFSGDSTGNLFVKWNGNSNFIDGSVIVITYFINSGEITYNKFGEKANIRLFNHGFDTVRFLSSDLTTQLDSSIITLTANNLTNNINNHQIINSGIKFAMTSSNKIFTTFETVSAPNNIFTHSFALPNIPVSNKFLISGEINTNVTDTLLSYNSIATNSSGSLTIDLQKQPTLICPGTVVTEGTVYGYTPATGTGTNVVYVVEFNSQSDNSKSFVITTDLQTNMPNFVAGVQYKWFVKEYFGMSLNDFVSTALFLNPKFISLSKSDVCIVSSN